MTAGSAVSRIAMQSDTRVATCICSADTLATLTLHKRWAYQATSATVVVIGLGIKWTITLAVAADISIYTAMATAATVVVIGQVVNYALAVAIVVVWVSADTDAAAGVIGICGSNTC